MSIEWSEVRVSRIYDALSNNRLDLSGSHDVHTPRSLVNEILDQIEYHDRSILTMFNLEWIVSLIGEHNVDPGKITFYSDHVAKTEFAEALGVRVINNLMTDKKFDVVVGNPPFQHTNSKNVIYQHFYNAAIAMGETIALITPKNMVDSLVKGNCDGVDVVTAIPTIINFNNIEQHFKGVGSSFCYFIIHKSTQPQLSTLLHEQGELKIDPTQIAASYVDSQDKYNFTSRYFSKSAHVTSTGDAANNIVAGSDVVIADAIKDGALVNAQQISKPVKKFKHNPFRPKVLFNILSSGKISEAYLDVTGNVLPSSKHNMAYILLDTPEEAEQAYAALSSDVFKQYVELFRERSTIWQFYRNIDFKTAVK